MIVEFSGFGELYSFKINPFVSFFGQTSGLKVPLVTVDTSKLSVTNLTKAKTIWNNALKENRFLTLKEYLEFIRAIKGAIPRPLKASTEGIRQFSRNMILGGQGGADLMNSNQDWAGGLSVIEADRRGIPHTLDPRYAAIERISALIDNRYNQCVKNPSSGPCIFSPTSWELPTKLHWEYFNQCGSFSSCVKPRYPVLDDFVEGVEWEKMIRQRFDPLYDVNQITESRDLANLWVRDTSPVINEIHQKYVWAKDQVGEWLIPETDFYFNRYMARLSKGYTDWGADPSMVTKLLNDAILGAVFKELGMTYTPISEEQLKENLAKSSVIVDYSGQTSEDLSKVDEGYLPAAEFVESGEADPLKSYQTKLIGSLLLLAFVGPTIAKWMGFNKARKS